MSKARKQIRNKVTLASSVARKERAAPPKVTPHSAEPLPPSLMAFGGTALAGTFLWAYWPTLASLVTTWATVPDYSHGFLVAPLACFFLWVRREQMPPRSAGLCWGGLFLIAAAGAVRWVSAAYFVEVLDAWSLVLWLMGVCWLCFGGAVFVWALPALAFLLFMVPLPFRAETALSLPLQWIATKGSVFLLQCFGQPALAEGTDILLGDHLVSVSQACAGLRMFMGIIALAYAYCLLAPRAWWERALLVLCAIPIAVVANVIRIAATAFLTQYASEAVIKLLIHDAAGWVTVVLAAIMFGGLLLYLRLLVREVEVVDSRELLKSGRVEVST